MNLINDKTFQKVILLLVVSRIIIFGASAIGTYYFPNSESDYVVDNKFLNGLVQYDGRAYLDIAMNGYNNTFNGSGNTAWFPLYPLLTHYLGLLLGGSILAYVLAGIILSNIFLILGITFLYQLIKYEFEKDVAFKTSFYILLFPTSYFFSVMYAESLFFFLTVAAFYFASKRNWFLVGFFGFFASLTRTFGIILFIPFIYIYLKDRKFKIKKINYSILHLMLIPVGLSVYLIFLWFKFGNPLFFISSHAMYGKHFANPLLTLLNASTDYLKYIMDLDFPNIGYYTLNLTAIIAMLLIGWYFYKKHKNEYSIYIFLSLVLNMLSGTIQATTKHFLVLFPCFIYIALLDKKYIRYLKAIYAAFFILLILFTIRHTNKIFDIWGLRF